MPGLDEGTTVWRYRVADPDKFEKFRVKELGKGVKITSEKLRVRIVGRFRITCLKKKPFKTREQVRKWLDQHLKGEIQLLLDFKAWNEYRRRVVNAYVQISNVS